MPLALRWKAVIALLIGLGSTLLSALLYFQVPRITGLDWAVYDSLTKNQSSLAPEPRIVIIAIDDDTFANLDIFENVELRPHHARLIKGLHDAKAQSLLIDIHFENRWLADEDAKLQKAITEASPMRILLPLEPGPLAVDSSEMGGYRIEFRDIIFRADSQRGVNLIQMKPLILDGDARGIYTLVRDHSVSPPRILPSGPVAMAAISMGVDLASITFDPDSVSLKIGPLVIPSGPDGEMGVRFLKPSTDFEIIEYSDALKLLETPEGGSKFSDKLVLLGGLRDSDADTASTVVGQMSGVEFMANALNTVLKADEGTTTRAEDWKGLTFAAFIAISVTAVLVAGRKIASLSLIPLIGIASLGIPYLGFMAAKTWLPAVPAVLSFLIALPLALVVDAARARHIAERSIPAFLKEDRKEDEDEQAVILFVDIRGSTDLVATVGVEEGRRILSSVLKAIIPVVESERGEVERSLGDGLMGIYRSRKNPDFRLNAIRSVNRMQEAILPLAEEVMSKHKKQLALSFGLEEGSIAGRILQTSSHHEWSSYGIDIHMAARLQAEAGRQHVACVIGPRLQESIPPGYETAPLAPFLPKGFSGEIVPFVLGTLEHGITARLD